MSGKVGYPKYEWHLGSYAFDLKYEPEPLKSLGDVFFKNGNPIDAESIEFADFVRNMIVKIGFMMFARELLKNTVKGKQIPTHYHLFNFVINTKAFLDAIANILNHHYKLGFKGAKIDLQSRMFLDKLKKKNLGLVDEISKQGEWIDKVVFWRNELVHKKAPLIMYHSPPNETGTGPKDITVKMTIEPVTMFNWFKDEKKLKKKYGPIEQDILQFCNNWVKNADTLLQFTCEKLYLEFKNGR